MRDAWALSLRETRTAGCQLLLGTTLLTASLHVACSGPEDDEKERIRRVRRKGSRHNDHPEAARRLVSPMKAWIWPPLIVTRIKFLASFTTSCQFDCVLIINLTSVTKRVGNHPDQSMQLVPVMKGCNTDINRCAVCGSMRSSSAIVGQAWSLCIKADNPISRTESDRRYMPYELTTIRQTAFTLDPSSHISLGCHFALRPKHGRCLLLYLRPTIEAVDHLHATRTWSFRCGQRLVVNPTSQPLPLC